MSEPPPRDPPSAPGIRIKLDDRINFAMQQNDVPVVKMLEIVNPLDRSLADVRVRIEGEPGFCEPWEGRIASIPGGATYTFRSVDLTLSPAYLDQLTERVRGHLRLRLYEGEAFRCERLAPVQCLARNEWGGLLSLPEILAAFVLPNHPAVAHILKRAGDHLLEWTNDSSLSGYQAKDRRRVRLMTAACFEAIRDSGIRYINPPASFEQEGQRIRLPDQIAEEGMGTCLDIALLTAASLEQCGLHPLLVITQGHALTGVWLEEQSFDEPAHDDGLMLRKRIDLHEIEVFDATMAASSPTSHFDQVKAEAVRQVSDIDNVVCVVDVHRSRAGQIRPLPVKAARLTADLGSDTASTNEPTGGTTAIPDLSDILSQAKHEPTPVTDCAETPATRLDRWKRKLLDLSLRNRLLNYRDTKKTIPITCPDLPALEDALADGARFKVLPRLEDLGDRDPREEDAYRRRTAKEATEEILRRELRSHRLRTGLSEADLGRQLLGAYRAAKTAMEEGGASSLYLAVGFLRWFEDKASQKPRLAPILLLPVELHRKSVLEGFSLTQGDDEPTLNVTLLEMLRQDHGLTVQGLDPLPYDDSGLDVPKILHTFRQAIRDIPRWDIEDMARIGLFSFAKFLMWRDLSERADDLRKNPVVRHLVERPQDEYEPDATFPTEEKLDKDYPPSSVFCPMPADASQLTAILAAAAGRSFVLEGPPGTGKSQTITNLIAHCLAEHKTILFVSEKMAALSVVHERLQRIGLGRYCLELHSNKAHKRQVLAQIASSIDTRGNDSETSWGQEAERLNASRGDLNAYVEALHREHPTGDSVFKVTSRLIGLRNAPLAPLSWSSPDEMSSDQLADLRDSVKQLSTAAAATGKVVAHPWRAVTRSEWTPVWESEVKTAVETVHGAVQGLAEAVASPSRILKLGDADWSRNELQIIYELAGELLKSPAPPAAILIRPNWDDIQTKIGRWIEHGRKRDELRTAILGEYERGILDLDLNDLLVRAEAGQASTWPVSWLRAHPVRKQLKRVSKTRRAPRRDQLVGLLQTACSLAREEDIVQSAGDEARDLLGHFWNNGEAEWQGITAVRDWASRLRSLAARAGGTDFTRAVALREAWATLATEGRESLARDAEIGRQLAVYRSRYDVHRTAAENAATILAAADEAAWGEPLSPGALEMASRTTTDWVNSLSELRPWCAWRRARETATTRGLGPLVTVYESEALGPTDFSCAFERGYAEWWYREVVSADPVLSGFFSPDHERRIADFRQLDDRITELAKQVIDARLAARVPKSNVTLPNSELGIIKREINKKRRHMALRQLFQRTANLLPRLKPCLLMSPISVAQYLDAAHPPFDVVVFDEASQIPVWDAVGAIARGKQAVIVGDPKQLPPTSFFSKTDDEDGEAQDADVVEDLESILDECIGSGLPMRTLNWHYRSQHESLIAFSNYNYYDNRLLTFPSSQRTGMGVSWRHVSSGVYDKGKTRTNRVEAEAVVDEIACRLRDTELHKRSIGVVTFSQAQQSLIEDLLEERRRSEPAIDPFFGEETPESVFVKNLENVQGDERDVILFSICYGPDVHGRVSMNFGPMNKEGGERRLNVAVTRARREVVVFSTLTADQIDLSRTRARGVADLKLFLEYARKGTDALLEAAQFRHDADFDSPFEKAVYEGLAQKGWNVHLQVGCSGYRIDLAVVDPKAPGRYLLGIECDGANYHRAKTARDRDKLREGVLRGLGWQLHRVWSTDWWANPDKELARIEAAIEQAEHEPTEIIGASTRVGAVPSEPASQPVAMSLPEPDPTVVPLQRYKPISTDRQMGDAQQFYEDSNDGQIVRLIVKIAEQEGPVSLAVVARRVAAFWGMGRVGGRILERATKLATCSEVNIDRSNRDETFIWPKDLERDSWSDFRVPGGSEDSQRDIEEISIRELANGAKHVLGLHYSIPMEDLVRETGRLFGFKRTGRKVQERIAAAIDMMLQSRCARQDGDTVVATQQ